MFIVTRFENIQTIEYLRKNNLECKGTKQDKVPVKPQSNKKYWMLRYIWLYWSTSVDCFLLQFPQTLKLTTNLAITYAAIILRHRANMSKTRLRQHLPQVQSTILWSLDKYTQVTDNMHADARLLLLLVPVPLPPTTLSVKRTKMHVWNCSVMSSLGDMKSVNWLQH